ncbi:YhgE/Pip domain-containing protein [Bacillus glycinifermentans]|uniref:YhgE/Pip domain-containing protein n=1 Tax=Bacillus glycinifermentans TaxID=1664069 RepID=UPI0022E3DECD|nr:YhgE/Pip domain-containing protein [Bacillus glycinifermentans]MEC0493805.1 YhgE/Pip domain-containing protein [Bacillus glycinifermentans]MEC0543372.1 YhgE/Pip domain-containing protein [Bacillus glycinifermentans]
MNVLRHQWRELITNKKLLISVIGVLFIPLIYSSVFLAAYWDPYGHVDQLPVAVVNSDKGATYEGKDLHIGDDLIKELKKNKKFDWHFTTKEKALTGLENEEYYMVVEIPGDFSKDASTVMNKHPKKLNLIYHTNAGRNYVGAQISDKAIEQLQHSVGSEISEQYAEVIFDNFGKIAKGLGEASSGAEKLNESLKDAKSGSKKLKENLEKLAKSQITFNNGMGQFGTAFNTLNEKIHDLDSALGQFQEKGGQLYNGAYQLQQGMPQIVAGLGQLNEQAQMITKFEDAISSEKITQLETALSNAEQAKKEITRISDGITKLESALKNQNSQVKQIIESSNFLTDEQKAALAKQVDEKAGEIKLPELDRLKSQIPDISGLPDLSAIKQKLNDLKQLPGAVNKLYKGSEKIQNGLDSLAKGQAAYNEKFAEARSGSSKIAEGSQTLTEKFGQLQDASGKLKDASSKLSEGAKTLDEGLGKITEGSGELSNKLADAADQTGDIQAGEQNYNMFSDPVKVKGDKITQVSNYGTGLTPYILSLGLFVGALMITVVFDVKEPASRPESALGWFFSKFSVLLPVGILQAVIACTVILLGIGLDVQSVWRFYLFSIIMSITCLAIIQFLAATMGNPGRFIAVILLVLQLGGSGGTFPLALVPRFFQIIHSALPMTYSIAGYRAIISSGDYAYMWEQAAVLGGIAVIMMALTIVYFWRLLRKEKMEAQPA